jgi:Spy/CpxP family protein refolding chaperone
VIEVPETLDNYLTIANRFKAELSSIDDNPNLTTAGKKEAYGKLANDARQIMSTLSGEAKQRTDEIENKIKGLTEPAEFTPTESERSALGYEKDMLLSQFAAAGSDRNRIQALINKMADHKDRFKRLAFVSTFHQLHGLAEKIYPDNPSDQASLRANLTTAFNKARDSLKGSDMKSYEENVRKLRGEQARINSRLRHVSDNIGAYQAVDRDPWRR